MRSHIFDQQAAPAAQWRKSASGTARALCEKCSMMTFEQLARENPNFTFHWRSPIRSLKITGPVIPALFTTSCMENYLRDHPAPED